MILVIFYPFKRGRLTNGAKIKKVKKIKIKKIVQVIFSNKKIKEEKIVESFKLFLNDILFFSVILKARFYTFNSIFVIEPVQIRKWLIQFCFNLCSSPRLFVSPILQNIKKKLRVVYDVQYIMLICYSYTRYCKRLFRVDFLINELFK